MLRSNTCNEIIKLNNKKVVLAGWVKSVKQKEQGIEILLKDSTGLCYVFSNINLSIKKGDVINVFGVVKKKEKPDLNIETGEFEVLADNIVVLSRAKRYLDEDLNFKEENKIMQRYIYLRKKKMHIILEERFKAELMLRNYLAAKGFIEIETPYLTTILPEGSDVFLVKSKKFNNKYWGLAQSPQLYKELLMIAQFDKYFQFARCFREEKRKSNYQPEFTQLDLEMNFVELDDLMKEAVSIINLLFSTLRGIEPNNAIVIDYDDALSRFGTVNVDLRYPHQIQNLNEYYLLKLIDDISEETLNKLKEYVGKYTISKLIVKNGGIIKKPFHFNENINLEDGIYLAIEKPVESYELMKIRNFLIEYYGLKTKTSVVLVKNIPLFIKTSTKKYRFYHNPFIKPLEWQENLENIRTEGFEIFINGVEVGGGGIRNINKDLLIKILKIGGYKDKEIEKYLGFFINALDYGVPPHGGFALGFDRLLQLILLEDSIREVIAFPKSSSGRGLLENAPIEVDENV